MHLQRGEKMNVFAFTAKFFAGFFAAYFFCFNRLSHGPDRVALA